MSMYDEKISEHLSLSKVLDALIESKEDNKVIVNFLKIYDNDFSNIASRSIYIDRIFCSDWLSKCHWSDAEYMLSHLEDINKLSAMYCAWQCLMLVTLKSECSFLAKHAQHFVYNNKNSGIIHPYSGLSYRNAKTFDIDFMMNGFYPEHAFDLFSQDELESFMYNGAHSLFANRLFQLDCFNSCSYAHKFIIIKNLCCLPGFISCNFAKQLLVADIEPEIKNEVVDSNIVEYMFEQSNIDTSSDYFKMLKNAKDYPSIAIHMTLQGEDSIVDGILYLLYMKKWKVLAEMAELDEDTMQSNFPIKDLIEYVKASRHAVK